MPGGHSAISSGTLSTLEALVLCCTLCTFVADESKGALYY